MEASLLPLEGGSPIPIKHDLVVAGRSKKCDLPIDHASVSRVHCVLAKVGDRLAVRDLESRNGTKVNGKRVERAYLQTNDRLSIAKVRFRVRLEEASEPSMPDSLQDMVIEPEPPDPSGARTELYSVDLVTENWQPGLDVFSGCKLVQQIGVGGFGEVWKADKAGFGPIALKRVRIEEPIAKETRALRAMNGLRHRSIVRVFGARRKENVLIIAMELGEKTLDDRLTECRKKGMPGIPQEELLAYTQQVAEALDYLYFTRKLLHRDVKPTNVLLMKGVAKLCDFGLAKVLEGTTARHSGVASYQFAPPEFFNGETVPGSDQYSLAAMYCYMLTGKYPVPGPDVRQMALQHIRGQLNIEHVPEPQQPVLRRALARSPADRYPSCVDFVYNLQFAAGGGF